MKRTMIESFDSDIAVYHLHNPSIVSDRKLMNRMFNTLLASRSENSSFKGMWKPNIANHCSLRQQCGDPFRLAGGGMCWKRS